MGMMIERAKKGEIASTCKTANADALHQYSNQLAFREVAENAANERFERGIRRLHRQADKEQARMEQGEARREEAKLRDAERVLKLNKIREAENMKGDVAKAPFYKDHDRLDRQRKFRQEQARQQQDRMLKDLTAKCKAEPAPRKIVPCPSQQGKNVCKILVEDDASTVASSI